MPVFRVEKNKGYTVMFRNGLVLWVLVSYAVSKERCRFSTWFCGHYHVNQVIDERFVIQWEQISRIDCN